MARKLPLPAPRRGFAPTADQRHLVAVMASAGLALADIARAIQPGGIALATLRRHFKEELATGRATATAAVARSLFQQACKGNVSACKLWLERYAGSPSGPGGKDLHDVVSGLVAGARQRLEGKLARLAAGNPAPPPDPTPR